MQFNAPNSVTVLFFPESNEIIIFLFHKGLLNNDPKQTHGLALEYQGQVQGSLAS